MHLFKVDVVYVFSYDKNSDVANLDEEIVAVHFEIVELQRSPFARTQVDVMEQLSVPLSLSLSCLPFA